MAMLVLGRVNVPGSKKKHLVLSDGHPPSIGNPYNGYINPYYWVDDHPLLYGRNGSLDPSTNCNGSFPGQQQQKPLEE